MEDSSKMCRSSSSLKIVDPHNYLLMTLDGIILRGIFEYERLKLTVIKTAHGNVKNLAELKQIMNTELNLNQYSSYSMLSMIK